jgi:tetratricopeptide (TPR) repeat protein
MQARLRTEPQWADGYDATGQLMMAAGRPSEAEEFLQKAVTLNPKLTSATLALGQALSLQAKYDQALSTVTKLVQEEPRFALGYLSLGQIQEMRGDWGQAESSYQKTLELERENVIAKNNLAWLYAEHGGNIDVALRLAQEAKEAKPDDPAISDTLGWIYVKKDTLGNAIRLLQESVDQDPKNAAFNYHLGVAYFRAGRKAEAKQSLETTLRLAPNFPQAGEARKMLVPFSN